MKTAKLLTLTALLIISTGVFAKEENGKISFSRNSKARIPGSPEDINLKDIQALRDLSRTTLTYPAFSFPQSDDLNAADIEQLKGIGIAGSSAASIAGSPDDINVDDINALKEIGLQAPGYPRFVLPEADDFNFQEIEQLKKIGNANRAPIKTILPNDFNITDIEALKGI